MSNVHLYIHVKPLENCHTCIVLDNSPPTYPKSIHDTIEEYDIETVKGEHTLKVIHFRGNDFKKLSAVGKTEFPKFFVNNPKSGLGNHIVAWSNFIMLHGWIGNLTTQKDSSITINYSSEPYINFLNVLSRKVKIEYTTKNNLSLYDFKSKIGWTKRQKKYYFLLQLSRFLFVFGVKIVITAFWVRECILSWNNENFARFASGSEVMLFTYPWLVLLIVNLIRYSIRLVLEWKKLE